MPTRAPWITVAVVCAAEILSMTPFSMFLALQPRLQDAWTLSNTVSGWISSAYFTGYMLAVPADHHQRHAHLGRREPAGRASRLRALVDPDPRRLQL